MSEILGQPGEPLLPPGLFGDPATLLVARARGVLLAEQLAIDPQPESGEIIGYAACRETYAQLALGRAAAEQRLLRATGHAPLTETSPYAELLKSWHLYMTVLPGDEASREGEEPKLTTVANEVVLNMAGHAESTVVEVNTHVVHAPPNDTSRVKNIEYFGGPYVGQIIFRGSEMKQGILGEALMPLDFAVLEERIRNELKLQALRTAVAPLVSGLMATPVAREREHGNQWLPFGLSDADAALVTFLTHNPTHEASAQGMLEQVFRPGAEESFLRLLQTPFKSLAQDVQTFGAGERLNWLTAILTETRSRVRHEVRKATIFGFKESFNNLLPAEVAKVQRLRAVAAYLEETQLVPAIYAPVNEKPAELTSLDQPKA